MQRQQRARQWCLPYTLNYPDGILHSKLILVDDEALSVGSANANPRGFFFDTELNVMVDDPEPTRSLRHRLWGHNLGVAPKKVAMWSAAQFFDRWDSVAKFQPSAPSYARKDGRRRRHPLQAARSKGSEVPGGKRGPIRTPFGSIDAPESLF